MKIRETLAVLKSLIEGVDPSVGKVHTTLRNKFDPTEIFADFVGAEVADGPIIKAIVIRPGEGDEQPKSTGKQADTQIYVVTAFISVLEKEGTEDVIEDNMENIRATLRKVGRLKPTECDSMTRQFKWTAIALIQLGDQWCYTKELSFTISSDKSSL